jgi:hypothetical protein
MDYRIVFVIVSLFGIAACSQQPEDPQGSTTDPSADTQTASHHDMAKNAQARSATSDADAYPLDVCVVSGEKLGSMGTPVEVEVAGQTVKLCCAACKSQLLAEPAKYLEKLNAARSSGATHDGHDHAEHDH